ncbi:MAG: hypothetical protein ACP5PW_02610, partial [Candidatus Dormibacteria bacterium]
MIYLDHAATTPVREEVREEMAGPLREVFGNPSSTHAAGRAAARVRRGASRLPLGARPQASAEPAAGSFLPLLLI